MISDPRCRGSRLSGTSVVGGCVSGIAFRLMAAMFRLRDTIRPPEAMLTPMGIEEGMAVVDYGCGPGSYLHAASARAGDHGRIYAVDINELAIAAVSRRIEREGLGNVTAVLAHGYDSGLPDGTADLVYALDMVHQVDNPRAFLTELRRIAKPDGTLIIDDGHLPRETTRSLIERSPAWVIVEETAAFLRCRPVADDRTTCTA
ncbi:MAG TPA: class I SAM-dependent methyltransferase [Methanoculleus sp.]|nr:class I SAM-dependent methyltransferase [Methanoculleus sp.]